MRRNVHGQTPAALLCLRTGTKKKARYILADTVEVLCMSRIVQFTDNNGLGGSFPVDAAFNSEVTREELRREGKTFRVVTDRQKTGMFINNVIPAWLGEELLKVKNGNPFRFEVRNNSDPIHPNFQPMPLLKRALLKPAGGKGVRDKVKATFD